MATTGTAIPPKLVAALRSAKHCLVLTGAGVSAESGIPTFRDALDGLWAKYDPMTLASPEGFAKDPGTVSKWYTHRRQQCRAASPNAGHTAVAQLKKHFPIYTVVTQLVDGMHQRAGCENVLELHGSLNVMRRCSDGGVVPEEEWELDDATGIYYQAGTSSRLRPGVVWFNEPLPRDTLEAAMDAASDCDVCLSVGTSSIVYPAAELPYIAADAGACVVEVNTTDTPLTPRCDFVLKGPSAEVLPALVAAMAEE